jgi:hypothetical protein
MTKEQRLIRACEDGEIDLVKKLLLDETININFLNATGDKSTPLTTAMCRGQNEIVTLLLKDKRIDPNKANGYGLNPFSFAFLVSLEVVQRFLLHPKFDQNTVTLWFKDFFKRVLVDGVTEEENRWLIYY